MNRLIPIVAAVFALTPAAAHAAEVKVAAGVLTYTDTDPAAKNALTISPLNGASYSITESGTTTSGRIPLTSDGSCTINPTTTRSRTSTATCPFAGVSAIEVRLGPQDDMVSVAATVTVGSRLFGEDGSDRLGAGSGDDLLDGGTGADSLSGGAGRDTADYSARTAPVSVSLNGNLSADDGEANEKDSVADDVEVLAGGSGDDQLAGNDGDNALLGNGGNDLLGGGGGNDQLDGGAGDDTLAGGTGADTITGGDGTDTANYSSSDAPVRVVLDGKPGDGAAGENDSVDTENVTGSPQDAGPECDSGANTPPRGG